MSGTVCYAMPTVRRDVRYQVLRCAYCANAIAMRCPVLTCDMLLPGGDLKDVDDSWVSPYALPTQCPMEKEHDEGCAQAEEEEEGEEGEEKGGEKEEGEEEEGEGEDLEISMGEVTSPLPPLLCPMCICYCGCPVPYALRP
eukprot:1551988-Rhodomonas_salina.3